MNEEKKYDQIQQYLQGTLKDQALEQFETQLAEDSELQLEVDLHQISGDAMELLVEDNLRGELQGLAQKAKARPSQKGKVVNFRRRIYQIGIAASFLLAIGFFGILYQGGQYSNEAIAGRYYDDALVGNLRGSNSASLLQEGMDQLANEDYPAALNYFDQVTDPALQAEASYAAGHAHYLLGNYPQAADNFQRVINSKDPRFVEKADLYFLLSGLANDQVESEAFGVVLDKILNNEEHLAHQQALQINKELKSFWRNF